MGTVKTGKKKVSGQEYTYVEKNIYKTGGSYRVRVGNFSEYTFSMSEARRAKKYYRNLMESSKKSIF